MNGSVQGRRLLNELKQDENLAPFLCDAFDGSRVGGNNNASGASGTVVAAAIIGLAPLSLAGAPDGPTTSARPTRSSSAST